eukprot:m.1321073 g.1321073  ORF g.1321073 m.1321073 type:complete len:122 (+) comp24846_c0_seq28:2479-2844(+)
MKLAACVVYSLLDRHALVINQRHRLPIADFLDRNLVLQWRPHHQRPGWRGKMQVADEVLVQVIQEEFLMEMLGHSHHGRNRQPQPSSLVFLPVAVYLTAQSDEGSLFSPAESYSQLNCELC